MGIFKIVFLGSLVTLFRSLLNSWIIEHWMNMAWMLLPRVLENPKDTAPFLCVFWKGGCSQLWPHGRGTSTWTLSRAWHLILRLANTKNSRWSFQKYLKSKNGGKELPQWLKCCCGVIEPWPSHNLMTFPKLNSEMSIKNIRFSKCHTVFLSRVLKGWQAPRGIGGCSNIL